MQFREQRLAGVFAFIAGIECIISISVAEALYPGYNVSTNYISDLGATCRTSCTVVQPASSIFSFSVVLLGGLGISASLFFYHSTRRRVLSLFLVLSGVGALGAVVFPETAGVLHPIFSLIVFLFGGLSALASYRVLGAPMNYMSVVLGVVSLVSLGLAVSGNNLGLGVGGMERMTAYPSLLWFVGFGAYMMKP